MRAVDRAFNPGVPAYALVLAVAFVSPLASVILTLCIAAFYLPSAALWERANSSERITWTRSVQVWASSSIQAVGSRLNSEPTPS